MVMPLFLRDLKTFTGNQDSNTAEEKRAALETMFRDHGFHLGENMVLLEDALEQLKEGNIEAAWAAAEQFAENMEIQVFAMGDSDYTNCGIFAYERDGTWWGIQMRVDGNNLWTEPKKIND